MDRKKILDARIKPEPNPSRLYLSWAFYATKPWPHSRNLVTSHKFLLTFDPVERAFHAKGVRRISKRKKRRGVTLSAGMVEYLKGRLSPHDIIKCTRIVLERRTTQP